MPDALTRAYKKARQRLFFLDYDGTLVNFEPTPAEARPGPRLLNLLHSLAADKHNTVIIVSGRDKTTLKAWLGTLPLTLVAEHGYFVRPPGGPWRALADYDDSWKKNVQPILDDCARIVPGSFVEEKSTALVWHYRQAPQHLAEAIAARLIRQLRHVATQYGLTIVPGNRVVEARAGAVNKGTAAAEWLHKKDWDFILAAGDDTTDEDLFGALPGTAITIKVGDGPSAARGRLPTPAALVRALQSLAHSS